MNVPRNHKRKILVVFVAAMVFGAFTAKAEQASTTLPKRDVIFVPTPFMVVEEMLKLAKVSADDIVYDLGCGDGRIVIEAAKTYGARGVGIDIDPKRIEEANERAQKEGVTDLVTFHLADLFETDFSEATVVTLYLLTALNERLRPKLWQELKLGARVVSHAFNMGDWMPDQVEIVVGRPVYFWTITEETKKKLLSEPALRHH
jgi:SAM-dependent methyltransferase